MCHGGLQRALRTMRPPTIDDVIGFGPLQIMIK